MEGCVPKALDRVSGEPALRQEVSPFLAGHKESWLDDL